MIHLVIDLFGFASDAFVHETVDSIIGDNYPMPDRILMHNEQIVHGYLMWAMCAKPRPRGKFDLYAVEGWTTPVCYIFKSVKAARLLNAGDMIALGGTNLYSLSRNAAPRGLRPQDHRAPTSVLMDADAIARLVQLVETKRPD